MSDEMTMVFSENVIHEEPVTLHTRAAGFALAHLFKHDSEDVTGVMNIVRCLSSDTLFFMSGRLEFMAEIVSNEIRRRG